MNALRTTIAIVVIAIVGGSTVVLAGSPEARKDRALYRKLTRQVRKLDVEYAKLLKQSYKEARKNDGKARLTTKSKLISLQKKRDRLTTRLGFIALRHRWPSVEVNSSGQVVVPDQSKQGIPAIDRVDPVIWAQFSRDAREVARRISLPVISLPQS